MKAHKFHVYYPQGVGKAPTLIVFEGTDGEKTTIAFVGLDGVDYGPKVTTYTLDQSINVQVPEPTR